MKSAKPSAILGIVILAVVLWPAAATAQKAVTIRLGHVGFPGSIFDIVSNKFAKDVNEALKGKVEVKVFHSSQLGSDEQMIKGIRVASPEMVAPSTVMSTVDQRYGVFEMPYLIVNRAHMKKVAENKQIQKALFDPLPARGIRVLGIWVSPHHQQPAADQGARGSQRHQVARAGRRLAREDVQSLWRESIADAVCRGVFGAPARRHGRPGEPVPADLLRQVP